LQAGSTEQPGEPRPQLRRLAALDAEASEGEEAPANDPEALVPAIGDPILVVKQPWLDHILAGRKTLEVRNRCCKPGRVWLGMQGRIFGRVEIGPCFTMTPGEFRRRQDQHLWPADTDPPYARVCGLPLQAVQRLPSPLEYWRPNGAVGWNIYRTKAEDFPLQKAHAAAAAAPKKVRTQGKQATGAQNQRKRSKKASDKVQ